MATYTDIIIHSLDENSREYPIRTEAGDIAIEVTSVLSVEDDDNQSFTEGPDYDTSRVASEGILETVVGGGIPVAVDLIVDYVTADRYAVFATEADLNTQIGVWNAALGFPNAGTQTSTSKLADHPDAPTDTRVVAAVPAGGSTAGLTLTDYQGLLDEGYLGGQTSGDEPTRLERRKAEKSEAVIAKTEKLLEFVRVDFSNDRDGSDNRAISLSGSDMTAALVFALGQSYFATLPEAGHQAYWNYFLVNRNRTGIVRVDKDDVLTGTTTGWQVRGSGATAGQDVVRIDKGGSALDTPPPRGGTFTFASDPAVEYTIVQDPEEIGDPVAGYKYRVSPNLGVSLPDNDAITIGGQLERDRVAEDILRWISYVKQGEADLLSSIDNASDTAAVNAITDDRVRNGF